MLKVESPMIGKIETKLILKSVIMCLRRRKKIFNKVSVSTILHVLFIVRRAILKDLA